MATVQLRLFIAGVMVAISQNRTCPPGLCCSLWGYCGTTADYCGDGCKSGPCYSDSSFNSRASVADIVSPTFFNGILAQAGTSCPGRSFYSREAFLSAASSSNPNFGSGGTDDDAKREIAAFFAHVTFASGYVTLQTAQRPLLGGTMATVQLRLFVAGVMVAISQNCTCPPGLCCSLWGYCGTTADYCGDGCKSGPCYSDSSFNSRASVADIVSPTFFNGILAQAGTSCPGRSFYSREAFLSAASSSYPNFGSGGTDDDAKREIAAFFAHVTFASGFLCYIESIDKSEVCCDNSNSEWPCVAGKKYYGRGPIQLAWNSNYGPAGQSIGFDGLGEPEKVATDPVISFKTALWYWMKFCHSQMFGEGFGATIRAINSLYCEGRKPTTVNELVDYYKSYCSQFGVDPRSNLTC